MKLADYQCHWPTPWMQESVSMHKSPTPVRHSRMNQAWLEEEEKDRKDRAQRADGKKGSPTKQKPIWGTKKGRPRHSTGQQSKGRNAELPLTTECDPLLPRRIEATGKSLSWARILTRMQQKEAFLSHKTMYQGVNKSVTIDILKPRLIGSQCTANHKAIANPSQKSSV